MVIATTKPHSLEAFLELPETKPASEFINNKISQKPMPQGKHSLLKSALGEAINQVVKFSIAAFRCLQDRSLYLFSVELI